MAPPDDIPGQRKRKENRQVVPVISFIIQVELRLPTRDLRARLWDVSQSGACLLLPATSDLTPGDHGELILHHPNGGESISTQGEVRWIDRLRNAAYAGVTFTQQVDFSTTFLAMLLSRSNRHTSSAYGPKPLSWDD